MQGHPVSGPLQPAFAQNALVLLAVELQLPPCCFHWFATNTYSVRILQVQTLTWPRGDFPQWSSEWTSVQTSKSSLRAPNTHWVKALIEENKKKDHDMNAESNSFKKSLFGTQREVGKRFNFFFFLSFWRLRFCLDIKSLYHLLSTNLI